MHTFFVPFMKGNDKYWKRCRIY